MNRRSSRSSFRGVKVLGLVALVLAALATFRVGPAPAISLESDLPGIGRRTEVRVTASEPKRGLSGLRVEFVQGERVVVLEERSYVPRAAWAFWGGRTASDELTVVVGSEVVEGIKEGDAAVRVVAGRAGTWLRSPEPAVRELALKVRLRPPALQVLSSFVYVSQGGCEAVLYSVGDSSVQDGVRAGTWWFPGYPLPGGAANERFALFGAPHDLEAEQEIRLVARDDVGNEARAPFVERYTRQPYRTGTIELSEGFMARVVPAILAQTPDLDDRGTLLENYLQINGELRKRNARTLIELSQKSRPEFLWSLPFLQMRNAQVMSDFAARRTYVYDGRPVDQQDHLGFDLASTRAAEIQAANRGIVLLAGFFGIYGNTVVIDHGYGLLSLYGHLSTVAVAEGAEVQRGDVVGRSGETGLAGGDHLHFTMLIHGMPVNPREWWDGHWIQDRLKLKLGGALPFEG
jgi:murein DD-endopeptidase MepM/ murein hydrolase activator NlpD